MCLWTTRVLYATGRGKWIKETSSAKCVTGLRLRKNVRAWRRRVVVCCYLCALHHVHHRRATGYPTHLNLLPTHSPTIGVADRMGAVACDRDNTIDDVDHVRSWHHGATRLTLLWRVMVSSTICLVVRGIPDLRHVPETCSVSVVVWNSQS